MENKELKTALKILNQVEPNGELLDTDQAIEAMELYAEQFKRTTKEVTDIQIEQRKKDFEIFIFELTDTNTVNDGSIKEVLNLKIQYYQNQLDLMQLTMPSYSTYIHKKTGAKVPFRDYYSLSDEHKKFWEPFVEHPPTPHSEPYNNELLAKTKLDDIDSAGKRTLTDFESKTINAILNRNGAGKAESVKETYQPAEKERHKTEYHDREVNHFVVSIFMSVFFKSNFPASPFDNGRIDSFLKNTDISLADFAEFGYAVSNQYLWHNHKYNICSMHPSEKQNIEFSPDFIHNATTKHFVPVQKCPICEGRGEVSKPLSDSTFDVCDVCKGEKVIPMREV